MWCGLPADAHAAAAFDVEASLLVEGVFELLPRVACGASDPELQRVVVGGLGEHGLVAVLVRDGAVPEVGVGGVVGSGSEADGLEVFAFAELAGAVVEVAGERAVDVVELGSEGVAFGLACFRGGELLVGGFELGGDLGAFAVEAHAGFGGVVEGGVRVGDLVFVAAPVEWSVVFVEHGLRVGDLAFEALERLGHAFVVVA